MKYRSHTVYHIFNQGNNKQKIFYREENYRFFLEKMSRHLSPYTEILSYCLMPNHFHWLVFTKPEACELSSAVKANRKWSDDLDSSDHSEKFQQNLSHQIKTLLSSYTRAINKQENRSGSLFRQKTKVKDGIIDGVITVNGKDKDLFFKLDNDYGRICFDYIHNNPVKAKLVKTSIEWKYSSARDYAGLRKSSLCNLKLAKELLYL